MGHLMWLLKIFYMKEMKYEAPSILKIPSPLILCAMEKLLDFVCLTHWLKKLPQWEAGLCQMNKENIDVILHALHPKRLVE